MPNWISSTVFQGGNEECWCHGMETQGGFLMHISALQYSFFSKRFLKHFSGCPFVVWHYEQYPSVPTPVSWCYKSDQTVGKYHYNHVTLMQKIVVNILNFGHFYTVWRLGLTSIPICCASINRINDAHYFFSDFAYNMWRWI